MDGKPILTVDEQIEKLRQNGVAFELSSVEDARYYLTHNNNYFKLTSYRKNFDKYPCGEKAGTYRDLDFAYLKDLAIIDMHLRYLLLQLALDVEHYAKQKLLHRLEDSTEDGYTIVSEYAESLKPQKPGDTDHFIRLKKELLQNQNNPYCGGIVQKYHGCYPVWAFIEIIPFGRLAYFYQFCAQKLNDREMENEAFLLLDIRTVRNVCAHNNCILNDLRPNQTAKPAKKYQALQELSKIGFSKNVLRKKMSNMHLRQIIMLLYMHRKLVTSSGVRKATSEKLHILILD